MIEREDFVRLMLAFRTRWNEDEDWMNKLEIEFGEVPNKVLSAIVESQLRVLEVIEEILGDKKKTVITLWGNDFDFKIFKAEINSFDELYNLIKNNQEVEE